MSKFGGGVVTGVIGTLVVQGILLVIAGKSLSQRIETELPTEPEVDDGHSSSSTVDEEVTEELKKYFNPKKDGNITDIKGKPYIPTVDEILDEEDEGPAFVFEE